MKLHTYGRRQEARDLFDIVFMLKEKKKTMKTAKDLILKFGAPKNMDLMEKMALRKEDFDFFQKVVFDASKTSD